MKNIILIFDSADNQVVEVTLEINGKKSMISRKYKGWSSQLLLPMIDRILKLNKISPKDLSEIRVNSGPGSFTGVRVGVTVANLLGWYLNIPVNGKKIPILHEYDVK